MPEPRVGPDVPGSDAPSPDVLDELLRAFSVDPDQADRHRDIDLTSPEVTDLLTPSGGRSKVGPAAAGAGHDDGSADGVDAEEDPGAAAGVGPDDGADETEDDEAEGDEAEGDDIDGDEGVDERATDDVASEPGGGERRVVVIDDTDGVADADTGAETVVLAAVDARPDDSGEIVGDDGPAAPAGGVVGDPFLRTGAPAVAEEAADDAAEGGARTISIVDEGLPDTVYIGGNLEPTDVGRSTVVIDDRDPGDSTISLEDAATATKIEPRIQERRTAVKRAKSRKRLKWGIAATLVILVVVAALALLGSGLFAVDRVAVEGAEHTTDEELAAVVDDLEGTPVLLVDGDRLERELEQLPWVEDARVTTRFPNRATIELRERTPAAVFQGADAQWRTIDDTGRVLAVSETAPPGYLPILGEGFPSVEPGVFAPTGLQGAAQLATYLTPNMLARTREITVTPDGSDLRMTFTDETEVRFGPATDLVQKLVRLETKLADLGDEQVSYLDVTTNEVGQG